VVQKGRSFHGSLFRGGWSSEHSVSVVDTVAYRVLYWV